MNKREALTLLPLPYEGFLTTSGLHKKFHVFKNGRLQFSYLLKARYDSKRRKYDADILKEVPGEKDMATVWCSSGSFATSALAERKLLEVLRSCIADLVDDIEAERADD